MTSFDLFASSDEAREDGGGADLQAPLAVRMRPRNLDEVRGQAEVLRPGSPLRRLVEGSVSAVTGPMSAILWGPPGTGKTTLAHLVATAADRDFVQLSAVTAGVKDVRAVMERAATNRSMYNRQTVLFLDEIHRFSKAQQDALLPGVENREVVLVAATTENPSFSVIAPLLSRSILVTLESLSREDVGEVIDAALTDERGLAGGYALADDARDHLIAIAGGDARRVLTSLEASAGVADDDAGVRMDPSTKAPITLAHVEQAVARAAVRYDKTGDQHYDVASAFIKSMRGSDVDAALHYLARQLEAGEDPRFIARRIVISASEDVGLGDPTALQTAVAALHAVAQIGMPEARIILAQAVVHNTLAPKSNAAYTGINEAIADVRAGKVQAVPPHLRGSGYTQASDRAAGASGGAKVAGYVYAHEEPDGVAAQQYLPDDLDAELADRSYYRPTDRGFEARLQERWVWLRERLRRR